MKKLLPAMVLGLALTTGVNAQDTSLLGDDFRVDYYGQVNGNYVNTPDYGYNYTYAWLNVSVTWKEKIRAVLTTSVTAAFEDGGVDLIEGETIEEFIKEAYIEIREVGGTPVAIIVGKRTIPFANKVEAMPVFGNNPIEEEFNMEEVFGLTVKLDKGLLGILDSAEISAFETEQGDLKLGTINGVSVKLDRALTRNFSVSAGHVIIDDENNVNGTEHKTTVGLITKTDDGDLMGWVNGMLFSNNPDFPNSDFAITAGAKYQVTDSTDVVVEMTYVEKEVMQYAIGTNTALTRRVTVGVEARYNDYLDGRDSEIIFGANARYTFGVNNYAPNEEYLFDGEND